MSTFTIRVTSSATNVTGTAYGQQPDLGAPSFLDMYISGSTDPGLPDGQYDAYCLNPLVNINLSPSQYGASNSAGNVALDFTPLPGLGALSQTAVNQLNWLLSQNFTADPKFGGQYNFGEVQVAIWKICGFTDAQITGSGEDLFLTDNGRQVVSAVDINFLVNAAQTAVASGNGVLPTDAFFSTVIDVGGAQPLIVQLQSAKLGNFVWLDSNSNGIQDSGEAGVDGVVVELYNSGGTLVASTVTGDDFSTAAVEHGFYQFAGLHAGSYQVKFGTTSGYAFTTQDANGNSQDTADSDANASTGLSQVVTLANGESNQTIDAGLVVAQKAHIGDFVFLDKNANGVQDSGEVGIGGVTVTLCDASGNPLSTTVTNSAGGYGFDVDAGTYSIKVSAPSGYFVSARDQGSDDALDSDIDAVTGKTVNYTLAAGQINTTVDAGLYQKATIGDRVWYDNNGNGIQDAGEQGVAGVHIDLRDNVGLGNVVASTVTDANGNYLFTNVTPGDYRVDVDENTLPAGYEFTQSNQGGDTALDSDINGIPPLDPAYGIMFSTTLDSGEDDRTWDAGIFKRASLGDRVWLDSNGNGLQDSGEAGKAGVTVYLLNEAGAQVATQTTDVNGNYLFTGLVPGKYSVQFVAPSGYILTGKDAGGNVNDTIDSDADQATGKTGNYTLASGDDNRTVDAGLAQKAHIGDLVFEDKNANGVQDAGEAGIAGVTVTLCDGNGNPLATTTTDGLGVYGFDVNPGTYSVKVTAPAGYFITTKDQGADDAKDSDIDALTGKSGNYVLNSGDVNNTVDGGLYKKASLGDRVWLDTNGNGLQDSGEAGKAGVVVTLCDSAGLAVATQTTDANGNYLFTGLQPGTYSVQFAAPTGYLLTTKDAGANANDTTDGDADQTTGKTGAYTLASGDDNRTVDAGLIQKAHIGDLVFLDKNANGVQDAGEAGIAGVTVTLCDAGGNPLATTTTDGLGVYGFDVNPGTYSVKVTAPTGYFITSKDVGADDAKDSDIDTVTGKSGNYVLNSGDVNNTVDGGLYKKASLGDRVWLDTNGNGLQDSGEAGKAGVVVTLCNAAGTAIATQTTDVNGNYLFTDLVPGTYSVQFAAPVGYVLTTKDAGGNANDTTDSDADQTTGKTGTYTLASGDDNRTVDAGLVLAVQPKAHIGDLVFEDKNANGVQDVGESGIAGVTVTLCDASGNPLATTTTNGLGIYGFDVSPGTYSVKVTAPADYFITSRDVGADDAKDSDIDAAGKTGNYVLAANDVNNTEDAGLYKKASLGDRVWIDSNGNGLQDSGEAGKSGVTVTLCNAAGTAIATQVTDANGNYLFTGLMPGSYSVQFAAPAGYLLTTKDAGGNANDATDSDADQATGKTGSYTLVSGESNLTVDAGLLQKAHIGDLVFDDKNANGVQDAGEAGIAGVTVTLCDGAGNPLATTTTNASGIYGFDVLPGTYSVKVTAPTGYFITSKDVGADDSKDSDIDSGGKTGNYTLNSGDVNNTVDGGLYKKASLGDRVWIDSNGNGLQDSGEAGKAGVTVNLCNAAGTVIATQTTDANGNYLFTGLVPGSYSVQFVAPTGYTLTTKDAGANANDATDSDADQASGKTVLYTLASGDDNRTVDAGLVAPKAHIGDFVFEDKNANGVQDTGEVGIGGVTVNLLNAAGTVVATTTTSATGLYGFDVAAGTYSVQVIKPTGYVATVKDAGGNDLTDSDTDTSTGMTGSYTLAAGETNNSVDAGFYKTASIGDRVWLDCNGNGVQDNGEMGVAGVTVKLLDSAGNTVATQTTDANGNYLFTTLKPGSYALQFGTLSGYSLTTKDAGGNDTTDSDADTSTGKTIYTTLDSGEVDRTWDAGLTPNCRPVTFDFAGNSATDGTDGNSRSYTDTLTGVSVTARAFSQDKGTDNWQKAYLGAYGGGLGVTDSSEGSGSGNSHTIDNVGRNNYVVLQFSQDVKLDMAYLGYVVGDSDVQVWIGSSSSTITTMSNAVLASMGFSEVNTTELTTARWADLNAGGARGNVVIIAADTTDVTPEDYFKLQQIAVCAPDFCTPVAKASIGDVVWEDKNYNGVQDAGEGGVANVTVKLLSSVGAVLATTTTDANGKYLFSNLNPGDYKIQVVTPTGYFVTKKDQGANDAVDSDIDSTGTTVTTTLVAGENDLSWDAGIYRKATVGDKVWVDANHNNLQDAGEAGVANIKVALLDTAGNVLATTTTNSSGNYQFSNLDPGTYVLQFDKGNVNYNGVNLKDWMWAKKDVGSNDAIDSDVAGDGVSKTNISKTDAFTLVSGQSDQTRDAAVTPLVIDLDGNGIHTVSRQDATGSFDLFGNGTAIKSGWVSGGDGLLAVDRNGNGKIDNISELFGGNAKGAGFASLAAFDSNHDGVVNSLDAEFGKLMIWRDANGNHQTDAGEMVSLAQAGVASLTVAYTELPFIDAQGNMHLERSSATLDSGASVDMTDVYFNVSAEDAKAAGVALPTMADLLGDDRALDVVVGGSDVASVCQVSQAVQRNDAADASCHGGDAGEVLRRLAALSREESHAAAA